MTAADRDLVAAIRSELAAIDPPRHCCQRAEMVGLAGAFAPRRAAIARLVLRLRRGTDAAAAGAVLPPGEALNPAAALAPRSALSFDWPAAPEHCRMAFLRGRFLARGSLSLASARPHLEFVVPLEEAPLLAGSLAELGLPASWRIRRGSGVVTWKSTEKIVSFLRHIGGGAALLELEARQVSRTVRGDLNRVINAESANLQRAVAAAARQLAAIETLEADGRLARQPYVVRVVADGRRETPEATFTELAQRLGLHRSAVQRALDRIDRLALHDDEGVGLRSRD